MAGRLVCALLIFGGSGVSQTALANVALDVNGTPAGLRYVVSFYNGGSSLNDRYFTEAGIEPIVAVDPAVTSVQARWSYPEPAFGMPGQGFTTWRIGPNVSLTPGTPTRIVPAPGTTLLIGIGTGLVGWLRWRKCL